MNFLGIDYGTKHIGLAYSTLGIIATLPPITNDIAKFTKINSAINQHQIDKVYVGISEGGVAQKTQRFVDALRSMIKLPVETVEESVSTIEATTIYIQNRQPKKQYKRRVDSISAAVILNRVISSD